MTRDENNNPILELAEFDDGIAGPADLHVQAAPGHPIPQRQADDLGGRASPRSTATPRSASSAARSSNVARWDAPDQDTFVIRMKKVQPTFIEILSSFSASRSSSSRPRTRTIRRCSSRRRHRAVAVGRVRAGRPREAEALRWLQAEHQLRAEDRLRRLQAGLLRHRDVPYRDRAAGAAWPA